MSTNVFLHIPVLLKEVITNSENLEFCVYVDCTLGLGGHSKSLLDKYSNITLVCIDLYKKSIDLFEKYLQEKGFNKTDSEITCYVKSDAKVFLVNDNFANLKDILQKLGILQVDVVLADLGLSTFQIKEGERGFSFNKPTEILDMRISPEHSGLRALDLLNFLSEKQLFELFKNFGESEYALLASKRVVEARKTKPIKTVGDFLLAIKLKKLPKKIHPATKLFMALRIAVNSENTNLKTLLETYRSLEIKKALIITFHSLEANTVISFAKKNNFSFREILPAKDEIDFNKSSRSAKLYVIQK